MDREPIDSERERRLAETVDRERPRLLGFLRRHAPSRFDAEDILQDVFAEFVEAYRLTEPIQQAGAWLFRVARNRLIDRFRRQRTEDAVLAADPPARQDADAEEERLLERLPGTTPGPAAVLAQHLLAEELAAALADLPPEQREVFVAHEIEGRSFRELAAATGTNLNTLLARKRYAVLRLRERLTETYRELTES